MFSKKKQQAPSETKELQAVQKSAEFKTEKDNYGDEDKSQSMINIVGKVGKAQHNFFRQSEKVVQTNNTRPVSVKELSQHKSIESAWLSLNGTVYNVTNYIKYHPGGRLILQGCGTQCSELFNKYHSWVNGDFLLKKYKIGYLVRQ